MPRGKTTLLNRFFIRGIAALLPTMLTLYILYLIWDFVNRKLGEPINRIIGRLTLIGEAKVPAALGTAIGVLLILLVCMLVGFLLTSFIGRRVFRSIEQSLSRLPFLRAIYPPIKQVTDFFVSERGQPFRSVVAVEYPRKGVYSLGFVTGAGLKGVQTASGQKLVSVFIPSSPTPMTGYVVLVPEADVTPLDMSVDAVLRFTISGGVLVPPAQGQGGLPEPGPPGEPSEGRLPAEQGDRA